MKEKGRRKTHMMIKKEKRRKQVKVEEAIMMATCLCVIALHTRTCVHAYSIYVYHINARMKCKGTVRDRFRVACSKSAKTSKLSWIE